MPQPCFIKISNWLTPSHVANAPMMVQKAEHLNRLLNHFVFSTDQTAELRGDISPIHEIHLHGKLGFGKTFAKHRHGFLRNRVI